MRFSRLCTPLLQVIFLLALLCMLSLLATAQAHPGPDKNPGAHWARMMIVG